MAVLGFPSSLLVLEQPERGDRSFIGAFLRIAKIGATWLNLPVRLCAWTQAVERSGGWSKPGPFNAFLLAWQESDHKPLMMDSSFCTADKACTEANKIGPQVIRISRSGLGTATQAVFDVLANRMR